MTPIRKWFLFALLLWLTTAAAATGDETAAKTLTVEMVADLKSVRSVAVDPAGERVAYVLEVPRAADDPVGGSYRELWVASLGKGKSSRYTAGKERVGAPTWSADGKRIFFLTERKDVEEHVQVFSLRARGGEARPVTRHESSILAYRLSPDGSAIAFTARDPKSKTRKKAEKAGGDEHVHDDPARPRHRRLWLFDTKKKESRRLLADDAADVAAFEWTPHGEALVVQLTPSARIDDDYMNRQLSTVEVTTGEVTRLVETPGKLGTMAVSPGGGHLAFLGATSRNDPVAQSLFVVPLEGGEARNLTAGHEGSAADLAFFDDGKLLLLVVEGEHQAFYRVDPASGEREELLRPSFLAADLDLAGGRLALAANAPGHPGELYVGALGDGKPERFRDHNPELRDVELARQEVVEWTAADAWPIRGVLTYPLGYEPGERYPLILQVHGGPEGVSLDGWRTSAGYPVQLLARDGFLVLEPNYRGSSGRGVAFSKADHDDLGGREYDDVLAGVDALVERGLADPEKVGTGGWSYGGYLSAWGATRWSERFRAAVMAAGISNWISFTGTTDIPNEMSIVHWNSWWHAETDLHWERSPLAHLDKARTPTLILHGERDERVHVEQGLELYTGLRLKGVPARFVTYPREGHGVSERAHRIDAMNRMLKWFGEHLGTLEVEGVARPDM